MDTRLTCRNGFSSVQYSKRTSLRVVTNPKAFGILVHVNFVTLGHILSAPAVKPTFYIPRCTARGPAHCLRDLIPLFYRQIAHFALFGRQLCEFTQRKIRSLP